MTEIEKLYKDIAGTYRAIQELWEKSEELREDIDRLYGFVRALEEQADALEASMNFCVP